MVGIVLSAEQIRTAPPEVQQWIMGQLAQAYGIHPPDPSLPARAPAPEATAARLARCDLAEMAALFNQIRQDRLTASVLLEFGRDDQEVPHPPGLFGVRTSQILRDLRLADADQLAACFGRLTQALQAQRHDPDALLFAYGRGCCYVNEETHRSLRLLLASMLGSVVPAPADAAPGAIAPLTFAPPVPAAG